MNDPLVYGLFTALLVGFSKAGIPGTGILAVPIMAMAFEGKSSVGALLPLLIVGDAIAVCRYRRMAVWSDLKGLFLWVALGMGVGAAALRFVDASAFRPVLGVLVLSLLALELLRGIFKINHVPHHPIFVAFTGVLTGVATTMGNAAGPIMTIFLLARGQKKFQFVGSMAWFFFIVNVVKIPIYAPMGLISVESLCFDLRLLPGLVVGAVIGVLVLPKINQQFFKTMVMVLAAVASFRLLLM